MTTRPILQSQTADDAQRAADPVRILVVTLTTVFVLEAAIMLALDKANLAWPWYLIVDASVLSSLAAPILWWLVVRPLKRAAATARERTAKILEASLGGSITCAPDGTITSINPAAEAVLRVSAIDVVGGAVTVAIPGLILPKIDGKTGNSRTAVVVRRANGEQLLFGLTLTLLRNSAGAGEWAISLADVTRVREVEAELRRAEERYRGIVEAGLYGVWIYDADARITFVNERLAEMLGVPRESLVGRSVTEFVRDEDADEMRRRIADCRAGRFDTYEFGFRRGDGSDLRCLVAARSVVDSCGRFDGAIVMLADLSSVEQAERKAREADARFMAVTRATPLAVLTADSTGRIVYCNEAGARLFGYSEDEVTGRGVSDLVAWSERENHERGFVRAAGSDRIGARTFESVAQKKDGTEFPVELSLGNWTRERQTYFSAVVRDLTEVRRAEAERGRLAMAIEQTPAGVVITDAEANIQFVNPAYERITGYTRDEVVGRNPRLLKSGRHDSAFYSELWRALAAGRVWTGRIVNRTKSGSFVTVDASISPVRDATGRVSNYVGVQRDVTHEEELAARLQQSERMEVVGRLAGGVAHDFNNLLTVISGYVEILQTRQGSPVSRELAEVARAAERAAGLTRQLLAFSRRQVLDPRVLDINAVVRELSAMLRRLIGENVELVVALDPELMRVRADPGQIEQVLMNLVVNARDALPQGGVVTVETGNVELDANACSARGAIQPGPYATLVVADNGTGMDAETLRQVFDPFFTTKPAGQGTGLGLATVHGVVQQSGGWIDVESEIGRGTRFRILLPATRAPVERDPTAPDRATSPGDETILLAEDDEAVRTLATALLEGAGYTVLAAPCGEAALAKAAAHRDRIHLLISDSIMPGMSGRELIDRVKSCHPEAASLLMSGYIDDAVERGAIDGAGFAFLQKPFSPSGMLRRVREILDRVSVR